MLGAIKSIPWSTNVGTKNWINDALAEEQTPGPLSFVEAVYHLRRDQININNYIRKHRRVYLDDSYKSESIELL